MCGIFGFVSAEAISPAIVIKGLQRLEYRGYDSWGVATFQNDRSAQTVKRVGKISRAQVDVLNELSYPANVAIGHTRWATHGPATVENAHPHFSAQGRVAVVHNGIIENYDELRTLLEAEGFLFYSQTDTEVIAHLIESQCEQESDFTKALMISLAQLRGTYGLAVVDSRDPGRIYAARRGSPLVIGIADSLKLVSSDVNALLSTTSDVLYLEDGEWAEISPAGVQIYDLERTLRQRAPEKVSLQAASVERGRFEHYMLKEIHDQPGAIRALLAGHVNNGAANIRLAGMDGIVDRFHPRRIRILACGSSWHAGLIGKYYLEELAGVPTDVEYASEYRYRRAIADPDSLVIAISQSGETADTLAALRASKERGSTALGLVNVVGSTIARECGKGVYLHAGPELGVAATKSFTNQVVALLQIAINIGRKRGMTLRRGLELISALQSLPDLFEETLACAPSVREAAERFVDADHFIYVGRNIEFPVALEGALKLKEVSYIHAEGMPAAELKHGPIALITANTPTVALATQAELREKMASNIQEIRARSGPVIAVARADDRHIERIADCVLRVPVAHEALLPMLALAPLQLLAYHLAVLRGCDVDQPRNLAKCVTVE